ncbi:MAG: conjugal transfer protein TraX [Defluviitaleaceae bacterium]|nr:conjugal transfer protein TraX [Defluviitaleaceae bacterium]
MELNLSGFWLKIIAAVGMTLQHIALALTPVIPLWLQYPMQLAGGLTFPILAFLLVEGYKHTSSIGKYALRLLIFALIAQIPFMLAFDVMLANIMYTLCLGIVVLICYDKIKNRILFWIIFFALVGLTALIPFDWGVIGLPIILMFRIIEDEYRRRTAPCAFAAIMLLLPRMPIFFETGNFPPAMLFPIGCLLAMPINWAYTGEHGIKHSKILFYAYYPLHLVGLVVVAHMFGLIDFGAFLEMFMIQAALQ